jgi:hypothetical protein
MTAHFDWWPLRGCKAGETPGGGDGAGCSAGEWMEMAFAKPSAVSEVEIYWFDDAPNGGVRIPASWRLLYKDGDAWKPVETTSAFGTAKDAWNTVAFRPVTTSALRIEVVMQPGVSAGVQEWRAR